MMYLSRVELDRRNPSIIQSLRDCHDMHRSLMKAFPDIETKNARQDLGVLYRIFNEEKRILLYVLSESMPDWRRLQSNGFIETGCKDITKLLQNFKVGNHYSFDTLVYPSKKVKREDGGNSRRVIIRGVEEREHWLLRKAKDNGFELEWAREEGAQKISGSNHNGKGGTIFVDAVRFRGVLKVTDSEAFKTAYSKGIGPEKAYGCGMLLLAKA